MGRPQATKPANWDEVMKQWKAGGNYRGKSHGADRYKENDFLQVGKTGEHHGR